MNLFTNNEKESCLTPQHEEPFEENNSLKESVFQKRREKAILALKRVKEKNNESSESKMNSVETLQDSKDPLDEFMEKIENELKEDASNKQDTAFYQTIDTQERFDNEEDALADIAEILERKMENHRDFIDSDDELEVDENGNLKPKKLQRKLIPIIDHSMIDYKPFQRNIYKEPPELSCLSVEARAEFRNEKKISVAGYQVPQPIHTFSQLKNIVEQRLLNNILLEKHYEPTPIQAQLIPIVLSGYDVVALAETGAGKTEGYLVPAIQHVCKVLDSWSLVKMKPKEGPISLILSPTRELAMQTFKVAKRLCMNLNLRVSCFSGGYDKTQQVKEIRTGYEICVGTPGRVIDLCTLHGSVQMSLQSVTLFILDEADRMLNLDFNEAILSIHQALRPDRQVVFVSASFPTELEKLMLKLVPKPPMRVTVGKKGKVTESVEELVEVFRTDSEKLQWIQTYWLQHVNSNYCTLVFCKSRQGAMELCEGLEKLQMKEFVQLTKDGSQAGVYKRNMCRYLHGDMSQEERETVLRSFREKKFSFLIATDVASRGLNLPFCDTVVNFDTAKDWETYVHRVGRAVIQDKNHVKGKAYSLLVHGNVLDKWMAGMLVESLKQKQMEPTRVLFELAMTHEPFRAAQLCGKSFFETSAGNKKGKKKALQNSSMMGIGYTSSNTSSKKASTNVPHFVRETSSLTLQCSQPLKRRWDTQEDVSNKGCVGNTCRGYSVNTRSISMNEECVPNNTGKRLKIFSATDDISSSDDEKPMPQHISTSGLVNNLKEKNFSINVKNTKETMSKVSRWE